MKRLSALLLAVLLIFATPCTVLAQSEAVVTALMDSPRYGAPTASAAIGTRRATDLDALRQYLLEQFMLCAERINISAYNLSSSEAEQEQLWDLIYFELPEAFHIASVEITFSRTKILTLRPTYICTADEYRTMRAECETAADELLVGIAGNDTISDVDKALLIHDRLGLLCVYDHSAPSDELPHEAFTLYGALGKGVAVCQGYAIAYKYLLEQVGVKSDLCTSEALNHAWNIVYIDDVPYHVDLTWDDSDEEKVYHHCFLLSSGALYAAGHEAEDYDTTPTDTRYDDADWQQITTAHQLITLDAGVGSVEPSYLVVASGKQVDLPTPTRVGYTCVGWASAPDATSGTMEITADADETYYAVWAKLAEPVVAITLLSPPTKTTYYLGDALDLTGLLTEVTYADGSQSITDSGLAIGGYDPLEFGNQTVTLSYDRVEVTFPITVQARTGDVDLSGVIDVADILKLKDAIMREALDAGLLARGDIDVSGALDVADILGIKDQIMAA